MAKNKTTQTEHSVADFLNAVADERKRADSFMVAELMEQVTGLKPAMWGPSIVGFGRYQYTYESGHAGEAPLVGFSPRANAIVLYLGADFDGRDSLLAQLGKHKTGKGCLYINKMADVDDAVLTEMIRASFDHAKAQHSTNS